MQKLHSFILNDFLSYEDNEIKTLPTALIRFLNSPSTQLLECTMSLLNVICSFKLGRDYILPPNLPVQQTTIQLLTQILMQEQTDSILR